jgi:molecular chaperone HtpG
VLLLDSPIISHLIQKLETENEKLKFARVDSDSIDKLIQKDEEIPSKLTKEQVEALKPVIEGAVEGGKFTVQMENLESVESPFTVTVPEFIRRMKEMSMSGGGGFMGMDNMPEMYNLVVNTNHELVSKIMDEKNEETQKALITEAKDLAMLSQNLLHGEALTNFVEKRFEQLAD